MLNGINRTQRGVVSSTLLLSSASAMVILFTATSAIAQSTDQTFERDEIIVTARKKEETLQEVPLAISAFTEKDIRERSLTQLENVAMATPGLTFEDFSNGGYGAPVIRGTSQLRVDQLEQNVSVFYDGIYIPRQYMFDLGMTNISRIEVVKGPQSALYGANSFSGAINYVSSERNLSERTGSVSGGVGLDGLLEANGHVSVPLIEDTLAVSVSGALSRFDGEFDNAYPGAENAPDKGTDETVGGWDRDTFAIGATFQNSGFTAKLDYSKFDALNEDGPHYRLQRSSGIDMNCAFGSITFSAPGNRAICGELPEEPVPFPVANGGTGTEGLLIDPRAYLEVESDVLRTELNFELTDNFALNYLFGRTTSDVFSLGESSRDPVAGTLDAFGTGDVLNVFTYGPDGSVDYKTHEIRADIQVSEKASLMVGAFFMDGNDVDRFSGGFAPLGGLTEITSPVLPLSNDATTETDTKTSAIFASLHLDVTDDLSLDIEGRYSDTNKKTGDFEYDNSSFTPRISIDYQLTDDSLLYASFAKGEKSGGINASSVELLPDEIFYEEDKNNTYEIGTKNTLLNGRATLNAAAYLIDWDNLQSTVYPTNAGGFTSGIVGNLGAAESKGLEVDGTFNLTENFTLNGGFSFVDATYNEGTASTRFGGICDEILCNTVEVVTPTRTRLAGDIGGKTLARVPETQWTIGAQYDGQFGNDYDYFLRGDIAGQGKQFVDEANLATIQGRTLANVRAGLSKGPISASLWVTNLADTRYVSNAFFFSFAFDTSYVPTYGAGRRGGVTLTYDF